MLSFYVIICLIVYSVCLEIRADKVVPVSNTITVQSVKCNEYDKTFVIFTKCYLKPINRTTKYFSINIKLLKPPVTKSHVQFTVWKKANGYKPFVINVTLDICEYFAGRKNLFFNWFYDMWKQYSNINHTCPYTSDMTVDKLPLSNFITPSAFPEGLYRFDLDVGAYGIFRAGVQLFLTIS